MIATVDHLAKGGLLHFPFNRVEIASLTIPTNMQECTKDQIFYNRVPKFIVLVLIDNQVAGGMYGKSMFNFQHYGLKEVDLSVNGTSRPSVAKTPNFPAKMYLREYMSVMEARNMLGNDTFLPFTYDELAMDIRYSHGT